MRRRAKPLLGCVAILLLATSVAAQTPITRIINGQPTADFEAVGIVGSTDAGGFCTGTLISPIHVLTAGHCAQFIDGDAAGTFEVGGKTYATTRIEIHPAFDAITLENDVAILELAEPVADVEPAQIFRGTPLVGDELTIVGFGAGGTPEGGAEGTFGEKMVGVTFIDEVNDLFIFWDFDSPNESNTAPGDSGGPGFIEVAGEMFIASITSGGTSADASLGDTAFNARVDTFAAWIDGIAAVDVPGGEIPGGEIPGGEIPDDIPGEIPDDEDPSDDDPSDETPVDETPTDQEQECPGDPVRQVIRDIVAELLTFLASDSFTSLLLDLADGLRGETATE